PSILTPSGLITEDEALAIDLDVIPKLHIRRETDKFRQKLHSRISDIRELISRHLQIPETDFVLYEPSTWIEGGFNVCLSIDINNNRHPHLPPGAVIRFPLPFNIGESFAPGTVDEKLRCEAATYIWMRENCPCIPLPRLLGMGFPGPHSFTSVENGTFLNRLCWYLRRVWDWFRDEKTSPYCVHRRSKVTDVGYLLLEWVENGKMLFSSWDQHRHDKQRTANLYRGIARTMLELARVPLPRIGSWTMDDKGVLSLTNRPFFDLTLLWNRHKIPTGISRDTTYTSTESFIHDTISYQEQRMTHQKNSILSVNDGINQLSALVGLRALLPHFWNQESRNGPFVLSLPDLHASNIFVDDDWNIISLIDLEFAPVVPVQMVQVPHWLSNRGVDQLDGPEREIYKQCYDRFVNVLEQEESASSLDLSYSKRLRSEWHTGRLWYVMALSTINAFPGIFEQHLQPRFFSAGFRLHVEGAPLSRLWCEDVELFVAKKLEAYEIYKDDVRGVFAAARCENDGCVEGGDGGLGEERTSVNVQCEVTQEC
ncbi:unnamed protein product, partial [Aureobasidium uvarum]